MDEAQDEVAPYFNRETTPKILLTTSDRPSPVSQASMTWTHWSLEDVAVILNV